MTEKNHEYNLYIVDDKKKILINGHPVKHCKNLEAIFEKDPKAVIRLIWTNNKKSKDRSSTS